MVRRRAGRLQKRWAWKRGDAKAPQSPIKVVSEAEAAGQETKAPRLPERVPSGHGPSRPVAKAPSPPWGQGTTPPRPGGQRLGSSGKEIKSCLFPPPLRSPGSPLYPALLPFAEQEGDGLGADAHRKASGVRSPSLGVASLIPGREEAVRQEITSGVYTLADSRDRLSSPSAHRQSVSKRSGRALSPHCASPLFPNERSVHRFSRATLYFLRVLEPTRLLQDDGCLSPQTGSFSPSLSNPGAPGVPRPGRGASKPALDAQLPHGCLLHGLVDASDLSLRQRALHVAVGDAVAVAGPVCPGG